MSDDPYVKYSKDRIASRQIDELIGIARGLVADDKITNDEINYLGKWLVANSELIGQPLLRTLYERVHGIIKDGIADEEEKTQLLETLGQFAERDFEIGELLKPTTLPLCHPAPALTFQNKLYCFTGTFLFGQRKQCEAAIRERGGDIGNVTKKLNVLVIGSYVTDSWKHSSFGEKILKASDYRNRGVPISIVSEKHWRTYL
jgi:NAD-dependent DNA ligase